MKSWRIPTMAAVLLLIACRSGAQPPRRSQKGSVTQAVGATQIEVVYRRPVARGRELFGALVPWGRPWTPGADTATTIAFSSDVQVNGEPLAAGTYSLWMVPQRAPDPWSVIFSKAAHVFHIPYPQGQDVMRVPAHAGHGEHMETLAFYFPVVDADSAVLQMHWGTTVVPLLIRTR